MDAPGDRLEVVDRERPRVDVAVPADDVERVVVDHVGLVAVADAHLDDELAALAVRAQLRRRVDVAVVVRRVLHQLAVLVAVALRDRDQPGRLEHEVALLALRAEAVRRPARDDDVVARRVRQVAEDRLERARALVHEDDLVALAVRGRSSPSSSSGRQSEISTSLFHIRSCRPDDGVARRRHVPRREVPVRVRVGHPLLAHDRLELAELDHAARRLEVVEDRLEAREALEAHHLLREERAVVAEARCGASAAGRPGAGRTACVEDIRARSRREVSSWEGVTAHPHRFGGVEFRLGKRELGHLHGDARADLPFTARIRDMLVETGRAQPHHVLPESRLGLEADPYEDDAAR